MKKLEISLPRNERDQELVDDLTEATNLFLSELVSKRLQNTLKIKIHVRKTTNNQTHPCLLYTSDAADE